ncbi:MAG: trypsin-like peptidase domain-containing protein [Candidatus Sericytochromatia bacterium]|nr:trypsin-like peptidase domain-containing protein [Candidatus Sericytochromatia bacterium]
MARTLIANLLTAGLAATGGAAGTYAVLAHQGAVQPALAAPGMPDAREGRAQDVSRASARLTGDEPIADLVERVGAAVVNIDTETRQRNPFYGQEQDPFFGFFGPFGGMGGPGGRGGNPHQGQGPFLVRKGVGSGFVLEPEGYIVTNHHVIAGATKLRVTMTDGRKLEGKVVGQDPSTDLALVKVEASGLPTLPLTNPATLRVGERVIAIGSPLGLQHTVTAGILSAVNRDVQVNPRVGFLQTDAPINPGNSGGPLLNLKGEVIGVNTAVARDGQGIGFAIPVTTLKQVLPQLKAKGRVERAWLGVGVRDLPEERDKMFFPVDKGAVVTQVTDGSPAARAGLAPGDVILEVQGKPIASAAELIWSISNRSKGDKVTLLVMREGQRKRLEVVLDRMPDQVSRAMNQAQEEQQGE